MKKMYDIVISIILALGLIISVAIFSNAIDKINKKSNVVIVKGTANVTRPIKEYSFFIDIQTSAKDIDAAYNNLYNLEDRLSNNIEYKYTKETMNLESVVKSDGKTIQSYKIHATYVFKANKLEDIEKIRESVNRFTAQYVEMSLSDLNFVYGNINEENLINQATKDARNKAYSIVKENSKSLGNLVKIKQDKISINDEKATINVTVTYEIN